MPFQVECPRCGNKLNVRDEWAGKRLKCPKCAAVFPAARPVEAVATAPAAATLPVEQSRVRQLAMGDEIQESRHNLPFTFGPDDRYPRLLYWGFMVYLLLDAIFAIPFFVSLLQDRASNHCVECVIGRAMAIVTPPAIGVCLFVAYSIAALMYAGYKLLFVGIVITAALGLQMVGGETHGGSIALQAVWHAVGLVLGLWYFMVRRE